MSARVPTEVQLEAAARRLFGFGVFQHWWPKSVTSFDGLDPIGREEFLGIVEAVLIAANEADPEAR
jgi:hypothetical protein